MTESLIILQIPERLKQLGYEKYHIRYRDFTLQGNATQTIPAFNELWYVVDDPPGIIIESAYGVYDSTGDFLLDNVHEHRGEVIITNPAGDRKRIKFIQVIIVN